MEKTLAEMSSSEFEHLVERAVDRRLEVWLIQLMDALLGASEGEEGKLKAEFANSLRLSMQQAKSNQEQPTPYTPVALGGLWKGVTITDEDIAEIRREMWVS